MIRNRTRRRAACLAARAAAMGSAVMLILTAWGLSFSGLPNASAATDAGFLTVVAPAGEANAGDPITSGGSTTPFALLPPPDAACTGDTAADSYTVSSFMVPESVDPATLTFNSTGPTPVDVGTDFRQPLYEAVSSSSYVNEATLDNAGSPRPKPGQLLEGPGFNFAAAFVPGDIPAGTYTLGLACVKGPEGPTQLDKFWTVQLDITEDLADEPTQIAWTVVESSATTTTTAGGGATTTTAGGGTTTTTEGDDTTTTTPDDTTSTIGDGTTGGDDGFDTGGEPSGTPIVEGLTTLPATGSSAFSPIMWAALLIIFGRMAILLGRPPRVIPLGS